MQVQQFLCHMQTHRLETAVVGVPGSFPHVVGQVEADGLDVLRMMAYHRSDSNLTGGPSALHLSQCLCGQSARLGK